MKNCTNKECKENNPQPLENFPKNKNSKDGAGTWCKKCMNAYAKNYRSNPEIQEQRILYLREYRKKPEVKEKAKQRELDPKRQAWVKDYCSRPEVQKHRSEYNSEYIQRSGVKERRQEYEINRLKNNEIIRLQKRVSRTIASMLRKMGFSKNAQSCLKYLPYTIEELRNYLQEKFDPWMSWKNYGDYWNIDHIIPQSKLPYSSMADENFKKCWDLSNLQPLPATLNFKKQDKDWEEFKQSKDYQDYLKSIGKL